mgnify:FL=1
MYNIFERISAMKQTIQTDHSLRELCAHGTPDFPLQINHDNISDFQDNYIRCHWHGELEISLVTEGTVLYLVGGRSFRLGAGQGLIINTNTPHMMTPAKGSARFISMIVHPSFLYGTPGSFLEMEIIRPYLDSPELSAVPLDPEKGDSGLLAMFREVDRLCLSKPFAYQLQVHGLLCTAFGSVIRRHQEKLLHTRTAASGNLKRLQVLLDYIHGHYSSPLSLTELSAQIPMSRENCCRFFRQMTGCTISQYLNDYRISRSIYLMKNTDLSVSSIASLSGFSSASRFAAAFRKKTGLSPSEYRRNHFITTVS